jgi:hypothetical protein
MRRNALPFAHLVTGERHPFVRLNGRITMAAHHFYAPVARLLEFEHV